jgi:hypothetical protein
MTNPSVGVRLKTLLRRDYPPAGPPPTYRDAVLASYCVLSIGSSVIVGLLVHRLDAGCATLLLFFASIRTYSLYRSVAWIWKRGWTFREKWNALTDVQRAEVINETPAGQTRLFRLYWETGGLFIPFGVRALVAWRWYDRSGNRSRPLKHQLYRLWKFYFFTIAWAIAVCAFAVADRKPSSLAQALGTLSVLLVMLGCISIGIEAALSYLILGGWSLSYHQLNVQVSQKVTELAAFAGGALSLILSVQTALVFVARVDQGFQEISPRSNLLEQVGRSFYYTITMLTGNGDPAPTGYAGHLVAGTAFAASTLFLVVVISLLFDAISVK